MAAGTAAIVAAPAVVAAGLGFGTYRGVRWWKSRRVVEDVLDADPSDSLEVHPVDQATFPMWFVLLAVVAMALIWLVR